MTNGHEWVTVQGVIVGWLDQEEDGEHADQSVAVVQAEFVNAGHLLKFLPPRFWLRWLGNDHDVVISVHDSGEVGIGDTISFTTNAEEQRKYAATR